MGDTKVIILFIKPMVDKKHNMGSILYMFLCVLIIILFYVEILKTTTDGEVVSVDTLHPEDIGIHMVEEFGLKTAIDREVAIKGLMTMLHKLQDQLIVIILQMRTWVCKGVT